MELKKHELDNFQTINNQVLIKITRRTDEIEYGNLKLYYDNSFDDYRNAVVTGTVMSTPDKLRFGPGGMHYKTEMELQKDDMVWFHFMSFVNAMPGENQDIVKKYECEGEDWYCILVNYGSIFIARRDDKIIPLNGYCLVEPTKGEDIWKSNVLIQSGLTKEFYKHSETFGVVKHLGAPIEKYVKDAYPPDDDSLNEGDTVVLDHACDIPLEVDLHRTLERENKKPYYRVLRKDILGVVSHVD